MKEKEEKKRIELKNSNGKHKQDVCMAVQHPQKNDGAENAMGASNPRNQVRTFARSHVRTGGWERLRTAEAMSDTSFSSCARKTLISSSASTFACFIRSVLPARSTETTTDQKCEKSTHKCIMRIVSTIMIYNFKKYLCVTCISNIWCSALRRKFATV